MRITFEDYPHDPTAIPGFPYANSNDGLYSVPYNPYLVPYPEQPQDAPQLPVTPPRQLASDPLQPFMICRDDESSDDTESTAAVERGADGELLPPQTLRLPRALLGAPAPVPADEDDEESEEEDAEARRRAKKAAKKKAKKKKKKLAEKPDPRLDPEYWLSAPMAVDCCISPVDEDPVPYEVLANM